LTSHAGLGGSGSSQLTKNKALRRLTRNNVLKSFFIFHFL